MARRTVTMYVSDLSGKEIDDERQAVQIEISWPADGRKVPVVLDALESEADVQKLLAKGTKLKRTRGPNKAKLNALNP